jgi:elongation factor Ts
VTEISASLVKELRDQTGAGMMDCKRALEEAGGDIEAAVRVLREKGAASAAKRAGRETPEGVVLALVVDGAGTLAAVGCETEPVSNNDKFRAFALRVLEIADGGGDPQSLDEDRKDLVAKIGENIAIVGTAHFTAVEGGTIASYVHPPADKIGVLVQVRGGSPEFARKVAMHIAASRETAWIGREDVPAEVVTAEREIYTSSDEVQSKPEQAHEKIVEGMLNKRFFATQVLADQPWIHDSAKSVGQALEEEGAEVLEFERFELSA